MKKKIYEKFIYTFFLGALAKFRKMTFIFVISDRLPLHTSVRMEKLGFHWMDFHENLNMPILY